MRVRRVSDGNNQGMSSEPEVIGQRYELGSVLGRGGMGEVRAATDLRLGREVAVKLLRIDLAEQTSLRGRFDREARAAARITHPNVVAIYDTGEHDGVPFIVMERLPGNSLATELCAGRLSQPRACSLTLEVLSALDAAHQLGVIHRDIKPGNILIDPFTHAKVADFGIAKIAEDADQTTVGMLLGTASYLAPERLAGEPATPATDLYGVGVMLFEVLAGRAPFRGDTPLAVVKSISLGVHEPLGEVRPDVDPAVVAVIEPAMQMDPENRFQSASEMARALRAATRRSGAADEPTVRISTNQTVDVEATQPAPTLAHAVSVETAALPAAPAPAPKVATRRAVWAAGVGVVAVLVALLVVGLKANTGPTTTPPSTVTQPTSIPAPLNHAIDRLEQAVTP